jgi:hypothetical protein
VTHRRDQDPRSLTPEIGCQGTETAKHAGDAKVDQSHGVGQLREQLSLGSRDDQVHRETPVGHRLGKVHYHSLSAAATERGQKEGDGP